MSRSTPNPLPSRTNLEAMQLAAAQYGITFTSEEQWSIYEMHVLLATLMPEPHAMTALVYIRECDAFLELGQ